MFQRDVIKILSENKEPSLCSSSHWRLSLPSQYVRDGCQFFLFLTIPISCIGVLYPATALANDISRDNQKQKQNDKGGTTVRTWRSALANFCFITWEPHDWHLWKEQSLIPSTTAVSTFSIAVSPYSDSHPAVKQRNDRRSARTVPLPNWTSVCTHSSTTELNVGLHAQFHYRTDRRSARTVPLPNRPSVCTHSSTTELTAGLHAQFHYRTDRRSARTVPLPNL